MKNDIIGPARRLGVSKRNNGMLAQVIVFSVLLILGIAYISLLNAGCERVGALTWEGKECF